LPKRRHEVIVAREKSLGPDIVGTGDTGIQASHPSPSIGTDVKKHRAPLSEYRRASFRGMAALAASCLLLATSAYGDFYKYTDEDGVETFTNTPTSSAAVKVLREGKPKPAPKAARRDPAAASQAEALPPAGQGSGLPVQGIVTSNYGWRLDPIDGTIRHHNGVDIAVPTGTKVKVIAAGRVVESGPHGGYGNLVTVEHGDGTRSMYGHNSRLEVTAGDQVEAGQVIALSGSTGRSTGPHLHFELWRNGSNVTASYLKNGAGIPEVAGGIRTYLHKDGSIVFTNLN
jgi:murein DD-endopeptidase MepM/ murein hydrolase activator NlpD